MSKTVIAEMMRASEGRMLGDGLHWPDIQEVVARCETWDDWYPSFADIGTRYERLAEAALARGHRISGGELLWRAAMSYHYAQCYAHHMPDLREEGQRQKVSLYDRAAPLFSPPAERIELRFEGFTIPGYLRLPDGRRRPPCAILIGGLESTKEESYLFENMCLARGVATFAFDGPGQGEMYFQTPIRGDFERFTSAVIDYLETRFEIDATRLGVLGRSLGGHYAAKSAAADRRLKSCVCWGALYELDSYWDTMHSLVREAFRYCAGQPTLEAGRKYLKCIDLQGWAERIEAPLYIQHGAQDDLIPVGQAERLAREARRAARVVTQIEPEGNHCCHNLFHVTRYQMADFLAETLGA
ncbi:MAG: alpha/beta hydrolase family protein [Candidatus Binatia bacterium]